MLKGIMTLTAIIIAEKFRMPLFSLPVNIEKKCLTNLTNPFGKTKNFFASPQPLAEGEGTKPLPGKGFNQHNFKDRHIISNYIIVALPNAIFFALMFGGISLLI